MKAEEARAMSEVSLKEITIGTYAEQVERRIKRAASHGKRELFNAFSSLDDAVGGVTFDLPKEQLDILIEHFRELGYIVGTVSMMVYHSVTQPTGKES